MKAIVAACCSLLFAFAGLADDFKTVEGKEYKNVKVSRVEPDGIVTTFSGGIVKIPFTELSPEIQKKYGYDPQAAAAFQQQTYQGDVLRAQQLAEARERRRQELEAAARTQPPPAPVHPVERQSVATSMHGSALDQRPGPTSLIFGTVEHVTNEGLVVSTHGKAFLRNETIPDGAYVLLLGDFPGFVDDDKIQTTATYMGDVDGSRLRSGVFYRRTMRSFEPTSISKIAQFPRNIR